MYSEYHKNISCLILCFLKFLVISTGKKLQFEFVTCGSALKLMNSAHSVRLHSHDVKYGSGSGQQSVTAVDASDDHNSYWKIKGKTSTDCLRGSSVKCGQLVRLQHVSTGRNLHSHTFQSPLSHNFEVSAFGENGDGDDGDYWTVVCSGQFWRREDKVRLKHITTNGYLHVTGDTYGRPIHGQKEVCSYPSMSDSSFWQAAEGVFIKPADMPSFDYNIKEEL